MNNVTSRLPFVHRLTGLFVGLILVVLGSFYFFGASAQTKVVEKPVAQNLSTGRLAFEHAYGTFLGPQNVIATSNADGTGWTNILGNESPIYNPGWSPDGTKMVYVYRGTDIYAMNTDAGNRVNITNTPTWNEGNPSWSVHNKIAYTRNSQIWVINSDGTNQMQFPGITQPIPISPVWSPNGNKLAFISGGDIWTINADGTNEQRVMTTAAHERDASWSPDGTKIIFARAGTGIVVVNLDGTNETVLTGNGDDVQPVWSPDGVSIAYRRNNPESGAGGLYVMNANGANQTRIFTDVAGTPSTFVYYRSSSWQPISAPRRGQFDFDGDSRSDISVFRPDNGVWYLQNSTAGFDDIPSPADYDGDGRADAAIYRNGVWWILNSQNSSAQAVSFGLGNDKPISSAFIR